MFFCLLEMFIAAIALMEGEDFHVRLIQLVSWKMSLRERSKMCRCWVFARRPSDGKVLENANRLM